MMSLATDMLMFEPAARVRTVLPLSNGVLVDTAVSASCLSPRAVCVAYVELMLTPPTWSADAFSVPKVASDENVFAPDIV